MPGKRILMTGSGGFVGRNLSDSMQGNYDITGIDLPGSDISKLNEFYTWDLLDTLNGYDTVVHLAGKAHDVQNTLDPKEYFDINVGLTRRVFEFFLRSDAMKFIFFSSVKAVADSLNDRVLTESFRPDPRTPYGESKLAAERYILNQKLPAGKIVYILRPCMIHGPGNKGNLNILFNYISKGLPYPLGAFENLRSLLSVQNLAWIVSALIDNPVLSGIYNVADDDPVSTNEIIELIAAINGNKPRIWNLPRPLVNMSARAGDWAHLPFNSERLKKLTESYIVSNSKIKKAIGTEKLDVSSRDGLLRTFESLLK